MRRFLAVSALLVPIAMAVPAGAEAPALDGAATDATTGAATDATTDATTNPAADATADAAAMEFSPALSGAWEGRGEVFLNMEQERPFNVKCELNVDASDTTFDLDGECGALFVKRPIRVSLTREGEGITGTYDADLRTGTAQLTGAEAGGAIEMEIEWGGEVNGDTVADMRIVRDGEEGLRIVFTDIDPATGEQRTTSDLVLKRG